MDLLHNWENRSKERQKDYKRFLARADKKTVLRHQQTFHEEAFEKINCLNCANCCKNYSPRFKTPDIKRISKVLRMKEGDDLLDESAVHPEAYPVVQSIAKDLGVESLVEMEIIIYHLWEDNSKNREITIKA